MHSSTARNKFNDVLVDEGKFLYSILQKVRLASRQLVLLKFMLFFELDAQLLTMFATWTLTAVALEILHPAASLSRSN